MREEFLHQVRLWNLLEGLPRIEIDPLHDGLRVQLRAAAAAHPRILRLIAVFGGLLSD